MFKLLVLAVFVLAAQSSLAISENIKIMNLDVPSNSSENYLIYGDNGFVYEIDQDDTELVNIAKEAIDESIDVEITLLNDEATRDILNLRSVVQNMKKVSTTLKGQKALRLNNEQVQVAPILNTYISDFKTKESISKLFNSLNKRTKSRSQCYNRAHAWSWSLYHHFHNGRRIQTGKVWVYFTKKYIRKYGHKWWFHIAPYVTLNKKEIVLDRSFAKTPESIQDWTNRFIKTKETCPEVGLYSEYQNRVYTDNCLIMKSSVHYWQPHQLKNAELKGWEQTEWKQSELKKAYSNAFGWFAKPPKL